jgi:hypothetical protein
LKIAIPAKPGIVLERKISSEHRRRSILPGLAKTERLEHLFQGRIRQNCAILSHQTTLASTANAFLGSAGLHWNSALHAAPAQVMSGGQRMRSALGDIIPCEMEDEKSGCSMDEWTEATDPIPRHATHASQFAKSIDFDICHFRRC